MIKVAITGNISAGKSVVESILKKEGFEVFDTDVIAHEILEKSDAVKNAFSKDDVLTDNKIDRIKLGHIVFSDKQKLNLLESIIHPQVRQELEKIFKKDYKIVFISVPQLFEAGFESLFDKIILVTADKEIRLNRLMKRNNLSEEDARIRINSQMSQEKKIPISDYIIENNTSIENIEYKIKEILKDLL